ncbi:DUF4097 domain-containing protein [Neobacillus mesonae]|nr:DUF4097 domain-containing protein [Neobacillus mesonae]
MKKRMCLIIFAMAALALTSCGNDPTTMSQSGRASTFEQKLAYSQGSPAALEQKHADTNGEHSQQHITQTREVEASDIRSLRTAEGFEGNIYVTMDPNADRITATLNIENWLLEEQPLLFTNTKDQTLTAGIRYPMETTHEGKELHHENVTLSIVVPEKLYTGISLITKSGYISVERMNASAMETRTGAGNLDLKQINAEEFHGKTEAGDVFFKINQPEHYKFMAKTHSGSMELLGEVYEDEQGQQQIGNGFNEVQLMTNEGNVRVYE